MRKLLGIAAILGAVAYFGKNKIDFWQEVLGHLELVFLGISGLKLDFAGKKATFKTDLKLVNPTDIPISVATGKAITISRIFFYTKDGSYLGAAKPNISNVEIPANGSMTIKKIPTAVMLEDFGTLVNNALEIFSNPNSLRMEIEVQGFGKTKRISA